MRLALVLVAAALAACAPARGPQPSPPPSRPAAHAQLDPQPERLVERVVDGDTVVLAGGERVRILGINALEMKHPDPAVHALALQAQGELAAMAEGRRLRVVAGMPEEPRDRYGRLLAYLELPGEPATDVGERLIEKGLARPYPSAHPRADSYRARASDARARGMGLWQPEVLRTLGLLGDDVPLKEAASRIGSVARIAGDLRPEPRGPKIHRLALSDGATSLQLVIFPSRYDEFPEDLVRSWTGRAVVTGKISEYRGRTQIVLEDPFQVEPRAPRPALAAPAPSR